MPDEDIVCQKCGAIVELPHEYSLIVPADDEDWEKEPTEWIVECPKCKANIEVDGTFDSDADLREKMMKCPKCNLQIPIVWTRQDDGEWAPEVDVYTDDDPPCPTCGVISSEHDDALCQGLSG